MKGPAAVLRDLLFLQVCFLTLNGKTLQWANF